MNDIAKELNAMMERFDRIASDEEKSQLMRDKVHQLVKVDALVVAREYTLIFKGMPNDLMPIMLAATLEAFVAFLLTQDKIILKEATK